MGYHVEGNNSDIVKKIMKSPRLMEIFMEYTRTKAEDREKYFVFIQWEDGNIDIVDKRKFKVPELLNSSNG